MKPWLSGDLSGVDPRQELPRIRDAVFAAAHRGEDLAPLVGALAALDPSVCAELVAGPRAVAHPQAVAAALQVVSILEVECAPSGLYGRLVDLAPSLGPEVLAEAVRRHPRAGWLVALSQRSDPSPGRVHLEQTLGTACFAHACVMYASAGRLEGLVAFARATPRLEILAALYRGGCIEAALTVGANLVEADQTLAVVGALAALHGPDLSFLGEGLLTKIEDPGIRDHVKSTLLGVRQAEDSGTRRSG